MSFSFVVFTISFSKLSIVSKLIGSLIIASLIVVPIAEKSLDKRKGQRLAIINGNIDENEGDKHE